MTKTDPADAKTSNDELTPLAWVVCGWPLLLIIVGGAVGGGLGGAAFGLNVSIYRSSMPVAAKIVLNILTGLAAVGIWFVIALAVSQAQT